MEGKQTDRRNLQKTFGDRRECWFLRDGPFFGDQSNFDRCPADVDTCDGNSMILPNTLTSPLAEGRREKNPFLSLHPVPPRRGRGIRERVRCGGIFHSFPCQKGLLVLIPSFL